MELKLCKFCRGKAQRNRACREQVCCSNTICSGWFRWIHEDDWQNRCSKAFITLECIHELETAVELGSMQYGVVVEVREWVRELEEMLTKQRWN